MENLRRLRKAKGLTMKELGEKVEVTESMIQMLETGKRKPSFELLLKLGEVLDCSVDDLVREEKEPVTESDGSVDDLGLAVSQADERTRELIKRILGYSPDQVSAFLSITQFPPTNQ